MHVALVGEAGLVSDIGQPLIGSDHRADGPSGHDPVAEHAERDAIMPDETPRQVNAMNANQSSGFDS